MQGRRLIRRPHWAVPGRPDLRQSRRIPAPPFAKISNGGNITQASSASTGGTNEKGEGRASCGEALRLNFSLTDSFFQTVSQAGTRGGRSDPREKLSAFPFSRFSRQFFCENRGAPAEPGRPACQRAQQQKFSVITPGQAPHLPPVQYSPGTRNQGTNQTFPQIRFGVMRKSAATGGVPTKFSTPPLPLSSLVLFKG